MVRVGRSTALLSLHMILPSHLLLVHLLLVHLLFLQLLFVHVRCGVVQPLVLPRSLSAH